MNISKRNVFIALSIVVSVIFCALTLKLMSTQYILIPTNTLEDGTFVQSRFLSLVRYEELKNKKINNSKLLKTEIKQLMNDIDKKKMINRSSVVMSDDEYSYWREIIASSTFEHQYVINSGRFYSIYSKYSTDGYITFQFYCDAECKLEYYQYDSLFSPVYENASPTINSFNLLDVLFKPLDTKVYLVDDSSRENERIGFNILEDGVIKNEISDFYSIYSELVSGDFSKEKKFSKYMKQDDKRKYDGFIKRLEHLNGNGARNVFGYDLSYVIDASPYYVAVLVNQDSGEILNEVFYMVDGQLQYLSLLSIHSLVTDMAKHNNFFKKKEFQFITSKLDYFLFLALASCGKS